MIPKYVKKKVFPLLVILLSAFSCKQEMSQDTLVQPSKQVIDSLYIKIKQQDSTIVSLKNNIPRVLVRFAECGSIKMLVFEPIGLGLELNSKRPGFTPQNYLCVPAAYTAKGTNGIDGKFVINGIEINTNYNHFLNGVCVINSDSILIKEANEADIAKYTKPGNSLFQQTLLLCQGQVVNCNIQKARHLRRALIQFKNDFCIVQSMEQLTLEKFQQVLLVIGAINAINLDMGTYSEGWYKNECGNKHIIGETMLNTNRQTSWLIFRRD
jgi:hypothetical protein